MPLKLSIIHGNGSLFQGGYKIRRLSFFFVSIALNLAISYLEYYLSIYYFSKKIKDRVRYQQKTAIVSFACYNVLRLCEKNI